MSLSGSDVETVELGGDSESHTLVNLRPDIEYIVTVIALYNGEAEGPAATARFKIGTQMHMQTHLQLMVHQAREKKDALIWK